MDKTIQKKPLTLAEYIKELENIKDCYGGNLIVVYFTDANDITVKPMIDGFNAVDVGYYDGDDKIFVNEYDCMDEFGERMPINAILI